jgi:DNA-directed RNA polymerase specialized sigma24 family protein
MTKSNHYVDNAKLVAELELYKERLKTDPTVRLPEYVGKCILDIATRFASRPNFYGYSYKEELISDGVENCLMYITNFDSAKSTNAFAYLTQICYYAFIRRIAKEKKQSYIKHKLVMDMPFEAFEQNEFDDAELSQSFMSYVQANSSFDFEAFEKSLVKKEKKPKPTINLDSLLNDNE